MGIGYEEKGIEKLWKEGLKWSYEMLALNDYAAKILLPFWRTIGKPLLGIEGYGDLGAAIDEGVVDGGDKIAESSL